jgi:hypothetical protein
MDPCKLCLVVAACQNNCENRINYVKRKINTIEITYTSLGVALILLMLVSMGISFYVGATDNYQLMIPLVINDLPWNVAVSISGMLACLFSISRVFIIKYTRKLKRLIGDV